jgi:hypothetical protein
MSQPCDCGEDECNVVCWRPKCKARYLAQRGGLPIGWQPIETAPKDGSTILFNYGTLEEPEEALATWSDRPVCMLGSRCGGFPPGWATPFGGDTDPNLPLDPANYWKPSGDYLKRFLKVNTETNYENARRTTERNSD